MHPLKSLKPFLQVFLGRCQQAPVLFVVASPPMLPRLTQAQVPLTREVQVNNEHGVQDTISIPAERPLTVFVDKRELVTLMTLGARPEWLVLGYLRNQRLVSSAQEVERITVDWDFLCDTQSDRLVLDAKQSLGLTPTPTTTPTPTQESYG